MIEKRRPLNLFFIPLCLIIGFSFIWGCAPKKKILKPQVPVVVQPPEEIKEKQPEADIVELLIREAEQFAADGNYQDALLVYNHALDEVLAKEDADQSRHDMIITGIERVLSEIRAEEIKTFSRIKNLSIPQDLLLYWLGYNYTAMEDYASAQGALEGFLETYPGHDREAEVKALLKKVRAAFFEKDTLGCILPLSGKYKVYGLKILQGIHLAIRDISRTQGRKLRVLVKDSKADPATAAQCVEELARENVFAIAGPLLVPEAAGKKAQELGIPMVALTQKSEFPAMGDYLFSNFLTPEMQVNALGSYIFLELGLKKVAILYPEERYGTRYLELFWDMVDRYQGEVVGAESYDGKKTDFTTALKKLTGEHYPLPDFLKPRDQEDNTQVISTRSSAVSNKDRVEIDFQALFIPDGLSRVNLILPQLAFNDIRGIVLLGTNLWHRKSLLTETKGYNRNAVICDGYFGESENLVTARFDKSFKGLFQETPGFLEAIAYDTASLLYTAVMDDMADSRESLKELLRGQIMFDGVTGRTVFDETGIPHKELFLMTVKKGKFMEIVR